MDIINKIKENEIKKVQLLNQVAELYELMSYNNDKTTFFNISTQISAIIITCCLLGKQYGISCNVMKKVIDKQTRLLLSENASETAIVNDLHDIRELFDLGGKLK